MRRYPGTSAYVFFVALVSAYACVEPYDPPLENEDVNMLVVDGFLNATNDSATVRLTRTLPVKSTEVIPGETAALVRVEDDKGVWYILTETAAGLYKGAVAGAGSHSSYRLLIRTRNNREYASEFTSVSETPEIDSITYQINREGVEFLVNTHDPSNNSKNFRWTFEETYQYNSKFNSLFIFEGEEPVFRPMDKSVFTCWRSVPSTDILVSSTKHLQQSVVSRFPIVFIPKESIKISVKYSLLVQQQSLTDEAYNYWLQLERSTENLGGLFDPLPSEVVGNIRSVSDPSETVIGFFSVGTVREKRIFVKRSDLVKELAGYYSGNAMCAVDSISLNELPQVHKTSTLLVDAIYAGGAGIIGYTTATISCADCRTMGGNTIRPQFWE